MRRIAFVTYQKAPQLTPDDAVMLAPLQAFDLQVVPAIWDDPTVTWKNFSAVILRSCRDYHFKPKAFRNWLQRLDEEKVSTWNPTRIARWNMDKIYLRELALRRRSQNC